VTRTIDHIETLRASEKFRAWKRPELVLDIRGDYRSPLMEEAHYAPDELAELWGVSTETIRSIFREEPGVLKIGKDGTRLKRG
jgi:hypothetical protein